MLLVRFRASVVGDDFDVTSRMAGGEAAERHLDIEMVRAGRRGRVCATTAEDRKAVVVRIDVERGDLVDRPVTRDVGHIAVPGDGETDVPALRSGAILTRIAEKAVSFVAGNTIVCDRVEQGDELAREGGAAVVVIEVKRRRDRPPHDFEEMRNVRVRRPLVADCADGSQNRAARAVRQIKLESAGIPLEVVPVNLQPVDTRKDNRGGLKLPSKLFSRRVSKTAPSMLIVLLPEPVAL